MVELYNQAVEVLHRGEPLVIALLLCFLLAIGFALGKGVHKSHKIIHTKWKGRKAAGTSELLE